MFILFQHQQPGVYQLVSVSLLYGLQLKLHALSPQNLKGSPDAKQNKKYRVHR